MRSCRFATPTTRANNRTTANVVQRRHPERASARRSFAEGALQVLTNYSNQSKRADAKPVPRTGIYEGVFVTFHRQSYFSHGYGRTQCAPTSLCEPQQSLPCVKGGGEPASRRDCFKGKVTFLQIGGCKPRPTLRATAATRYPLQVCAPRRRTPKINAKKRASN